LHLLLPKLQPLVQSLFSLQPEPLGSLGWQPQFSQRPEVHWESARQPAHLLYVLQSFTSPAMPGPHMPLPQSLSSSQLEPGVCFGWQLQPSQRPELHSPFERHSAHLLTVVQS
jgi:hypothetical protein